MRDALPREAKTKLRIRKTKTRIRMTKVGIGAAEGGSPDRKKGRPAEGDGRERNRRVCIYSAPKRAGRYTSFREPRLGEVYQFVEQMRPFASSFLHLRGKFGRSKRLTPRSGLAFVVLCTLFRFSRHLGDAETAHSANHARQVFKRRTAPSV